MAKKIVSGGGGGSHGSPIDWKAALIAEASGSLIPADAEWAANLSRNSQISQVTAQRILEAHHEKDGWHKARGRRNHRSVVLYWPPEK